MTARMSFQGRFEYADAAAQAAARAEFLEDHGMFAGSPIEGAALADDGLGLVLSHAREAGVTEWTGLAFQTMALAKTASGGEIVCIYESGPTVRKTRMLPGGETEDAA